MTVEPLADAASPIPSTAPSASDAPWPSPRVAWYAVFVFALVLLINFLDRGIVGLLMSSIKADLHLTDVQMSYLVGFAFIVIYVFVGLPVARWADVGPRRPLSASGSGFGASPLRPAGSRRISGSCFSAASAQVWANPAAGRQPIRCCPICSRRRSCRARSP